MEQKPLYVLHQDKKRAIIPKTIVLSVLGVIFYLGILLNIALLELDATQETLAKMIALGFIAILIILGIIIAVHRANVPIIFYTTYLLLNKKKILYTAITSTQPKRDPFDKMFKTYSISIESKMHLRHIPNDIDLETYLKQLIAYAQRVSQQELGQEQLR